MENRGIVASMLTALVLTLASSAWAAAPPTGLGHWITETGNYEVEIAPCEAKLCGTIVKVLGNRSMSDPSVEMVPVDPQPALGMKILRDLTPTGNAEWAGSVYNRENGKTYSCVVTLLETGQLQVRGYVGLPVFGRTSIWHRP